jgi:uncharacterized membrane protein
MAVDPGKMLQRTPEGYQALTWVLYIVSAGIAAATLGEFSGTLLCLGCIAVIVLASSRKSDAAATIYGSHLSNIRWVMIVNLIASLILITITVITLGLGVVITLPLYVILLIWTGFKLIRGMMKLNDGAGY